jgi:hypothetical protein
VTFGACIRAKGIRIAYCGIGEGDASKQKRWDNELNLYYSAVSQGLEPSSTKTRKIRQELDMSDRAGVPFNAEIPGGFSKEVRDKAGLL